MQVEQVKIEQSWKELLRSEFESDYFDSLRNFLLEERAKHTVYPPGAFIFNAFDQVPASKVRIVILGQDPYHGPGQAHGLCFSVPDGIAQPPSLVNIFKELRSDLGIIPPKHGNLEPWARQGVLLLNTTLTVRAHQAASHFGKGWERFTDAVITRLSDEFKGIIFILWGNHAIKKEKLINTSKHHILKAAHPSPLSAYNGFYGCKHFSKANEILVRQGLKPIDWAL